MIPADIFRDWVKRYDLWREFVFDLLSHRLSVLMTLVDEVVFQRMDRRVAGLLLSRYKLGHPLQVTHHVIAAELGSSREVISRILEDFNQKNVIEAGRGSIKILDHKELEILAIM